MSSKIPVGISACLMGEKVRFDGGHKCLAFAMDDLAPFVAFTAICPEMAIGLLAPRPTLRLVKNPNNQHHVAHQQKGDPYGLHRQHGGILTGASARRSLRLHRLRQIAELRYGAGANM